MSLIKWDPFKEMDRFFSEEDLVPFLPAFRLNEPQIDIYEKDGKLFIEMPLAGFKPENIDIEVKDRQLRISGKIDEEEEEKKKNYYRKEIKKGSFERVIPLPKEVDEDKGEAKIEDGLLRVFFPLKEEKEAGRKIPVSKK